METSRLTADELNYLYPITSVTVHRGGHLTVNRSPRFAPKTKPVRGNRKQITKLSAKSLRRLTHIMATTAIEMHSMITLTYGQYYPKTGTEVKGDLNYILSWLKRKNFTRDYVWFMEFQVRGAPHVHILVDADAISPEMRRMLAYTWVARQQKQEYFTAHCPVGKIIEQTYKMVRVNVHKRTWETFRHSDGATRYVSKYASKAGQKTVPKQFRDVGRFWGTSRAVRDTDGVEVDITHDELRDLLRAHGHKAMDWDFIPKYLWGVTDDRGGQ